MQKAEKVDNLRASGGSYCDALKVEVVLKVRTWHGYAQSPQFRKV